MRLKTKLLCALALPLVAYAPTAAAQWTNRYPKLANANHHVYLEGYNLPTMAQSPTDPAISPDGKTVAFSARGWLWTMDVSTRRAVRLTKGKDMDFRPAWSPDGRTIAFVRDTTRDTTVMAVDVASGQERTLVDTKGMDLDPAFSPDGKTLFYSSAEAGDLDVWKLDLASGAKTRLTTDRGQELNPQPINGGTSVAFVAKGRGDAVESLSLDGKNERHRLISDSMVPQMRITASPNGEALGVIVLDNDRWKLLAMGSKGGDTVRLAADATAPEAPSWSTTGEVWFVQPNADKQFSLYRTSDTGGPIEDMTPLEWSLGEPTARVTIRTRQGAKAVAARLAVLDGAGHPAAPERGSVARFDGQHGIVFFHSPGSVTLDVPAGAIKVKGTHGFDGVAEITRTVVAGQDTVIDLDLPSTGFNAQARGWYSGDLHNHLNYGGAYQLVPTDMVDEMRAEDLDVATPMLANLNTTLVDTKYAMWQRTTPPLIAFSQEVRPNVGHVGLVAANQLYTPWFYGPSSPGYSQANLMNADPLNFARQHGGLAVYVHPVNRANPFPEDGGTPTDIPAAMVANAVLGDFDTIEVACLWSDELGSSDAWYRFLNLGLPITATAGSDTMHNFYHMMAVGATRVYGKPEGAFNMANYLDSLRKGRSFVSSGPQLDFTVNGQGPGEVVKSGQVNWKLDAYSAVPVEKVEILVNGKVVWSGAGLTAAGKKSYGGKITVPKGGWVAARVYGGPTVWPSQEIYPFAHTSPVWIGKVGSTDPAAVRAAASDLLKALDGSDTRLKATYAGDTGARLKQHNADARKLLVSAKATGVFRRQ